MTDLTYKKAMAVLEELREAINNAADVVERAKQTGAINPNAKTKPQR